MKTNARLLFSLILATPSVSQAQTAPPTLAPQSGLTAHDFLYAGEAKERRIFIVRKGAVVWTYDDPTGRGEISDAMLLSNGNVLLAHQYAVKIVAPDKKVVWNYEAPAGTEIHTAMPIGLDRVLFVQNGDPAMVKVVNIKSGATEKQFALPTGNPKGVHGQFRHARLTPAGTLLVAHIDMKKVCEYDSNGKEIWSFPTATPWGVDALPNGNVLITDSEGVREVTRRGDVAWSYAKTEGAALKLDSLQLAWRLPNGNTILNNWVNEWNGPIDLTNPPIQAIEVTPDKKVVWKLSEWKQPNLGPATTIQILDAPVALETAHFGEIK